MQQDQIRSHDDLDEKQSKQKIQVRIDPKPQQSWCPLCTIPFYQPYFNVEERDIYMRLRCSIFSWKPNFLQCVGKNPDLWGPIWIATTIIFILFTGGNFSHYVISSDRDNFDYEYGYIPVAVILIYCTAFIVPILLGLLLKYCFKSEISIFEMVCLYGYSMAIYIPVLLLCIIPYNESQCWIGEFNCIYNSEFMGFHQAQKTEFNDNNTNNNNKCSSVIDIQILLLWIHICIKFMILLYYYYNFLMRQRANYEIELNRARRNENKTTEFDSNQGIGDLAQAIDIKNNVGYFEEVENEDAEFSHNAIIQKQLKVICKQGEYIKIIDTDSKILYMRNLSILQSLDNFNKITVLLNLKVNESHHLQGLWVGSELASLYGGINVINCQCYITEEFTKINGLLIVYSLLLADELFITCMTLESLNQFLIFFKLCAKKIRKPFCDKINIIGISQSKLDVQELELYKYFNQIHYVNSYPTKLIEFEWMYFDYQGYMKKPIKIKKWKSYYILTKYFLKLCEFLLNVIDVHKYIDETHLELMYTKIFEEIINEHLQSSLEHYWESITEQLYPQLPLPTINVILTQARLQLLRHIFSELTEFLNYPYFKIKMNNYYSQINSLEQQLISYNNEIYEHELYQKILDLKYQFSQLNILRDQQNENIDYSQQLVLQISNLFNNIRVERCTEETKTKMIKLFFSKHYPVLLKDFLHKTGQLIDQQHADNTLSQLIGTLQQRKQIQERKANKLIKYNEVLQDEVKNMENLIQQIEYQIKSKSSQFKNSMKLEQTLTLYDTQLIQLQVLYKSKSQKLINSQTI